MSRVAPRLVPALQRAVHTTAGLLDPTLRELDLTLAEANILAQLAAAGPQAIAQLHRALGHRRSTLTSILDRLERRGHIKRTPNTSDRRTFTITNTASGARAGRRILRELDALESAALKGLPAQELAGFWNVLDALSRSNNQARGHAASGKPR